MKKFTNFQLKCLENVKKNIVSTKFFYDLVQNNKEIFKPFKDLQLPYNESELTFGQKNEELIGICNTCIPNNNNLNKYFLSPIIQINEVNESEEEDKEITNNNIPQNKIIEQFSFLFDTNEQEKVPRAKTKTLYKEAFDKVEMRRAKRENYSSKTKLIQKYVSEKGIDKYNIENSKKNNINKKNNENDCNKKLNVIQENKSSNSSGRSSDRSYNSGSKSLEKN
jgi:hypothetical protein